jgi:AcrR family transcriptional regulator
LLSAIAQAGFEMLGEAMIAARDASESDPSARLAAIGQAHVKFALTHAGHFRVMFCGEAARTSAEGRTASSERTFDLLVQIIQECQGAGTAPPGDPQPLVLTAWSVVHGMATLWLGGSLPKTPMDPPSLVPLVTALLSDMFAAFADQAQAAPSR